FELLAGRRPYEPSTASPLEAIQMICSAETAPLRSIDSRFRGDLDTIIGKALEKQIERRYSSVRDFADDLRHYLVNEPINARRPNAFYRAEKFIRRHKVLVACTLAIIGALSIGLLIAARQAQIARLNARDAEMRLTAALVAQGDALLANDRAVDARQK